MKKKLLILPIMSLFLGGCAFTEWVSNIFHPNKDEDHEKEKQSQDKDSDSEPKNPYTATILTSGVSFFGDGTNIDNTNKFNDLKNYLNNQINNSVSFTDASGSKLVGRAYDGINYLQMGSTSGTGSLVLTTNKKIYSVEANVMCYIKWNDNDNIWIIDSWSHFVNGDVDEDLTYNTDDGNGGTILPAIHSVTKYYPGGTNTISFSSQYGRVLMESLKITWDLG